MQDNLPDSFYQEFFNAEYSLDFMLNHLPFQSSIALWDGIVMGGGIGITISSQIRIATEKTLFAMPECAIGLFPDVGASYFLNQIEFQGEKRYDIALFLALTGERLNARDCLSLSLATHFIRSCDIPELRSLLIQAKTKQDVETIVNRFKSEPPSSPRDIFTCSEKLASISTCFSDEMESVEEILSRLATTENNSKWLEKLKSYSPTSLKITLEQMRRGRRLNLRQAFEMEYRMVIRCMPRSSSFHSDFKQGVESLLIRKDKSPQWNPSNLNQIVNIQRYFDPLDPEVELVFQSSLL